MLLRSCASQRFLSTTSRVFIMSDILSVAPMMEVTDRYYRYMFRLLSKRTKLYTEMVVDSTILHTDDLDHHLSYFPSDHPVAVQLGGSNPELLAAAMDQVEPYRYDEVNLNCGCPSDRVASKSAFGCALMFEPERVAECMRVLAERSSAPVTVKCRLGADHMDSYEEFIDFVDRVAASGVTHFIVHARKAWLKGLNPTQNRNIPPLRYDWVFRCALERPHLRISINGGVTTLAHAQELLSIRRPRPGADMSDLGPASPLWTPDPAATPAEYGTGLLYSVMIGRGAWHDLWQFADADRALFDSANPGLSRRDVIWRYVDHIEECILRDGPAAHPGHALVRPLLSLFKGTPGVKAYKAALAPLMRRNPTCTLREAVSGALDAIPEPVQLQVAHGLACNAQKAEPVLASGPTAEAGRTTCADPVGE